MNPANLSDRIVTDCSNDAFLKDSNDLHVLSEAALLSKITSLLTQKQYEDIFPYLKEISRRQLSYLNKAVADVLKSQECSQPRATH